MSHYASETSVSVEKWGPQRRHRERVRTRLWNEHQRRMQLRSSPPIDECAWAAGLFEGEGTITMAGRRGRLMVMITSTDTEVIDFFQARWPGVLRTYQPKGNARRATCWTLNAKGPVEAFLRDIEFYVRTERVRRKIEVALEEIADRFPSRRGPDVRARSAGRTALFRQLNRRGRGSAVPALLLEGPK